jgi:hypothetical protein
MNGAQAASCFGTVHTASCISAKNSGPNSLKSSSSNQCALSANASDALVSKLDFIHSGSVAQGIGQTFHHNITTGEIFTIWHQHFGQVVQIFVRNPVLHDKITNNSKKTLFLKER